MQLMRIVFASVLFMGIGCALPEERNQTEDQRVDPASLEDSINDEGEAFAYDGVASNDTMALGFGMAEPLIDPVAVTSDNSNKD